MGGGRPVLNNGMSLLVVVVPFVGSDIALLGKGMPVLSSGKPALNSGVRVAVISAKNHKRQRRRRQSVTAKREKSQTPRFDRNTNLA